MREVLIRLLAVTGDWTLFAARSIRDAVRPPFEISETMRQLFELGCRSMPLIAASGFAVGIVLSMHTRASLARFGAEALIPPGSASRWFEKRGRSRRACCYRAASAQASALSSAP